MTLNECSKADLIWVIRRLLQQHCFAQEDYYLKRVLSELAWEREQQNLSKADSVFELVKEKNQARRALLAPYAKEPLRDIPLEILEQAADLELEIMALLEKWEKLMGIGV